MLCCLQQLTTALQTRVTMEVRAVILRMTLAAHVLRAILESFVKKKMMNAYPIPATKGQHVLIRYARYLNDCKKHLVHA